MNHVIVLRANGTWERLDMTPDAPFDWLVRKEVTVNGVTYQQLSVGPIEGDCEGVWEETTTVTHRLPFQPSCLPAPSPT